MSHEAKYWKNDMLVPMTELDKKLKDINNSDTNA